MSDGVVKKLLYVFETAPYANSAGGEALDSVLIGASFEQSVSLLFLHDGVFQLKRGQKPPNNEATKELKIVTKAFNALQDFDVSNIYVHDLSLQARGLLLSDLMTNPTIVSSIEVGDLIADQDKVFTF